MVIGARTATKGSTERVTGRIGFVTNLEPPGTLHVALRRSDVAHGTIVAVDVAAVRDLPGVIEVLTGEQLAALPIDPYFGPVFRDQPALAIERVRYIGEPVAAVAAVDERTARAAAELIDVEIEPLPAVFDALGALADDAPVLHGASSDRAEGFADIIVKGQAGNVCNRFTLKHGDIEEGFALADEVYEHEFRNPSLHHVAMEPHAAVAWFEGERLTVVASTQTPYSVRDALATMFHLPASSVRIVVPPLGGGFGGKTYPKVEPVAAVLAWVTGRPTKIVLSRAEDFLTGSKHEATIRLKVGVTHDGRIVAKQVRAWFNAGAYTDISPRLIKNGGYACAGPYQIPHVDIESMAVYTNIAPAGAFRGYGVAQAAWAYESQMDEIAAGLGIDRIEFRRRNLIQEGGSFATGETIHGAHFSEVLDDALTLFDQPLEQPEEPHIRLGRGCSVIIKSTITPSTSNTVGKLNGDGSLQILTSTVEMGQGTHTALAQIAAEGLGLDVDQVRIVGPDTDVTPYDTTTSSSRSTAAMGAAVGDLVDDLREQLMELAAEQLDADPAHIEFGDGGVEVKGQEETRRSLGQVVTASRQGTLTGTGTFMSEGGLDPETGQGIASDHWHQAALAAEVAVDTRTGKITVRRVRASVYAGTVVNPVNARMQIEGSIMFGLSQALYEGIEHDEGFVTNPNLSDYAVAGLEDWPEVFEVSLIEHDDDSQMHGLGESALPLVSPAVANAVKDALGVRLTRLPMTAERLLDAIEESS